MQSNKINLDPLLKLALLSCIPLIGVIGPIFQVQRFITFGFIPLLFLTSLYINGFRINMFRPITYYLLFFLFALLSIIGVHFIDLYLNEIKTVTGNIVFGFALYNFVIRKPEYIYQILFSFIIATFLLGTYLYTNGLLTMSIVNEADYRAQDEVFNANTFSYYIYLALFSFFILFHLLKLRFVYYLYFFSLVFYVLIIFLSGSRAGLLLFVLVNLLYWTYIGFARQPQFFKPTVFFILIVIVSLPLINQLFNFVLEQTNIGLRFTALLENEGDDSRIVLLKLAFQKFLDNPIWGVGAGNFKGLNSLKLFSHNNLMEVLVNQGVISLLFYLLSFFSFFKITLSSFYNSKFLIQKKIIAVILLFVITFFIYSPFYVFFKVIPFTGFIFTLFAVVYRIQKDDIAAQQQRQISNRPVRV